MDQTLNILTDISHGSKMGVEAIDLLIKKTEHEGFKEDMVKAEEDLKEIALKADKEIVKNGGTPQELGAVTKTTSWGMVALDTLANKSTRHLSEMLVKGYEMGIKETIESMVKNNEADKSAVELCEKFLNLQSEQKKHFQSYLS